MSQLFGLQHRGDGVFDSLYHVHIKSYGSIKSGPQAHLGKTDVCHLAIWYIFVNQSLAKTQKAIA